MLLLLSYMTQPSSTLNNHNQNLHSNSLNPSTMGFFFTLQILIHLQKKKKGTFVQWNCTHQNPKSKTPFECMKGH